MPVYHSPPTTDAGKYEADASAACSERVEGRTSCGFSVGGSSYPKGASGDTIAKLRLGGAPTPRSRVARMTKRLAPILCGQERRLRREALVEEEN